MPSTLPTHRNPLDALVAHSQSRGSSSSHFGRPILRWLALSTILIAGLWFLSPLIVDTGSLEQTWGKVKQQVPWVNNRPLPAPPPGINPDGDPTIPNEEEEEPVDPAGEKEKWTQRKQKVKNAFARAYVGYRNHAYPRDELLPTSGGGIEKINGWSLTAVEALSTMWLMDMKTEFWRTVQMLERKTFTNHTGDYIPFFETTIRYLGGYLSAYAFSGEKLLLTLADDIGMQLLPAFKTMSGLPAGNVMAVTGETRPGAGVLAEIASCQLEFKYLAKETGRAEYYERAEGVMQSLYNSSERYQGLLLEHWDITEPVGKGIGTHYAIGGNADSAYEYFLKQFLQAGDRQALDMYLETMRSIIDNLLYVSPTRGLLYVTDLQHRQKPNIRPSHKLEHLSCFLPGLLALGAYQIPLHTFEAPPLEHKFPKEERERHRLAAEGLAYTCWVLYADQASGVGPDEVWFRWGGKEGPSAEPEKWVDVMKRWEAEGIKPRQMSNKGDESKPPGVREPPPERDMEKRDYNSAWSDKWLMRPETLESVYILWKTSKNPVWRERGWKVFESIEKWAKTPFGYSSLSYVHRGEDEGGPEQLDDMPSYFLAETLKYLYLLFDDEDPIKFDQWVFNTEAHPLPVFNWTSRERERFRVAY
ncbi:mannosyl-oligosaccharide 1,2-alpha-mannosidase [Coprinopsis sp. MPI-PUGE-AT-0042]|nr:mannosyl-oligosaccharide 1,2-alpha-mannosidase [Coprinopsis sp. MPI-PUGE-AT-0042]